MLTITHVQISIWALTFLIKWSICYSLVLRVYTFTTFLCLFLFPLRRNMGNTVGTWGDWEWHCASRAAQEQHLSNNTFLWAVLYRLQKTVSTFAYLFHLSPFVEQMTEVLQTCCEADEMQERVCRIIRGVVQPKMNVLSSQSLSSEGGVHLGPSVKYLWFGTTWRWVNDDGILISGWTILKGNTKYWMLLHS